jgi:hypothetical protein
VGRNGSLTGGLDVQVGDALLRGIVLHALGGVFLMQLAPEGQQQGRGRAAAAPSAPAAAGPVRMASIRA